MKWKVEISDLGGNRRLLSDVLAELSLTLVDDEGKLFVTGPPLEVLDNPSDVHAQIRKVSEIAGEVGKHTPSIDIGFSVGSIVQETDAGPTLQHTLVVADGEHLHISEHVALILCPPAIPLSEEELKKQEEVLKERQYQELRSAAVSRLVSAVKHESALTVQRLLNQEPTPQILGHIADVIQDDLGAGLYVYASKNQMSRFYRSINHPNVFGGSARHIVSRQEPPPNPMNLAESTAFIRELARTWLNMKAGVSDT